jgi:hypothetical protein
MKALEPRKCHFHKKNAEDSSDDENAGEDPNYDEMR